MEVRNQTTTMEFILLGLTEDPELQMVLFMLFLLFYVIICVGNIGIIAMIASKSCLHTPMYFFLSNLSFSDFCYSSAIAPKMLNNLLSGRKSISFIECAAQNYFFAVFGSMECYLLSAMAYDRYAAICHPLLYHHIVSTSRCIQLIIGLYIGGFLTAAVHTVFTLNASLCGTKVIDHFYCYFPPLMNLSCTDRLFREVVLFAVVCLLGFGSLLITMTSYVYIISAILRIPSTAGRKKTFSTCSSHLTTLLLFYGTATFMYLRLPGSGSATKNKVVSVCYTIVIPMLNPLIYSLRNKDVKEVIRKTIYKKSFES